MRKNIEPQYSIAGSNITLYIFYPVDLIHKNLPEAPFLLPSSANNTSTCSDICQYRVILSCRSSVQYKNYYFSIIYIFCNVWLSTNHIYLPIDHVYEKSTSANIRNFSLRDCEWILCYLIKNKMVPRYKFVISLTHVVSR